MSTASMPPASFRSVVILCGLLLLALPRGMYAQSSGAGSDGTNPPPTIIEESERLCPYPDIHEVWRRFEEMSGPNADSLRRYTGGAAGRAITEQAGRIADVLRRRQIRGSLDFRSANELIRSARRLRSSLARALERAAPENRPAAYREMEPVVEAIEALGHTITVCYRPVEPRQEIEDRTGNRPLCELHIVRAVAVPGFQPFFIGLAPGQKQEQLGNRHQLRYTVAQCPGIVFEFINRNGRPGLLVPTKGKKFRIKVTGQGDDVFVASSEDGVEIVPINPEKKP